MNVSRFLSKGVFHALPIISDPKVFLAVDSSQVARNAFELYNPFSRKARLLKLIVKWLFTSMNPLAKVILPVFKHEKSSFISYLEQKLGFENIVSSLYIATDKNKVVLQLQSDGKIRAYVKVPLNELGEIGLRNEERAIEILSSRNLLEPYRLADRYENTPFLVFNPLNGQNKRFESNLIMPILEAYKQPETYLLKNHPRIKKLYKALELAGLSYHKSILDLTCKNSQGYYHVVFEHGDFAPWNVVQTSNGLVPFDFEYFEEHGLEHLDLIKYHYQITYLLKNIRGKELLSAIRAKVNIVEFDIVFSVFLIKEIIIKHIQKEEYITELSLLNRLNDD